MTYAVVWGDDLKKSFHGHRSRLKQRYIETGIKGWQDYEVLELALFYAVSRRDTKNTAKKLLEKFKSLDMILKASDTELRSGGASEHIAVFLRLVGDLAELRAERGMRKKDLLSSPAAVINYLNLYLKDKSKEEFVGIFLDNGNRLIKTETVFEGTINRSAVYPREIAAKAIEAKASGIIVAHNHPGGSLEPSQDDISATKALKKALDTVEIALLDHIIVSDSGYFSFREKGITY
ncbi:MAG TPA: hypothetical protein DEE98_05435 [Elusimicrobia bacterium]|nr:MAG: hypothetical protein A2278_04030 [Elusimicrobia bacterium RIFOXYA12_FULL_49_49]OGS06201.1 MAG: hypothetical protein A2204_06520 [Elusimicrobia bacterium RIFOXYA1_FULL_47_7]OGS10663.1 MAG: hypothetical protein A2386_07635 [Elusimicrobia bacterium RIFOXYB1_FULL_48_9]OGS15327.1 MAG: hypothetical protein A2251_07345 [Elusimicrobia bacterium RIFOXYA2_FULL_47_53]OGS26457.1 MAG: hypothetical protein A2339_01680 [Elusimicrobia bacterium RIFOXYB12_FULL_50_12]OGS30582.1 MAG: hypothetical protein